MYVLSDGLFPLCKCNNSVACGYAESHRLSLRLVCDCKNIYVRVAKRPSREHPQTQDTTAPSRTTQATRATNQCNTEGSKPVRTQVNFYFPESPNTCQESGSQMWCHLAASEMGGELRLHEVGPASPPTRPTATATSTS